MKEKQIMEANESALVERPAVEPMEMPQNVIVQQITSETPEEMLARAEKMAALAPRLKKAQEVILATQTYPADWEIFGKGDRATACLSSAGAERVGRLFAIHHSDVKWQKETGTDRNGEYYRYIFEGFATEGNRTIWAQGTYSTRDKFLGFAHEKYKPQEEINENDIRNAAYHIFCGNVIKALLGLRNIPVSEYQRIMKLTGQQVEKTGKHTYGTGTKGGTNQDDKEKQQELARLCIAIADAGNTVITDGKNFQVIPQDEELRGISDSVAIGKAICETISSFKGKDDKQVKGLPASQLKGQRLDISLQTARKLTNFKEN